MRFRKPDWRSSRKLSVAVARGHHLGCRFNRDSERGGVVDDSDRGPDPRNTQLVTAKSASPDSRVSIGVRGLQCYWLADMLSGFLLIAMLTVTPWLFGTTQPHTMRWLNWAGWAATILLLIKWGIRRYSGYRPARWDTPASGARNWLVAVLAWLTAGILSYMLVSLLNARATWNPITQSLDYHEHYIAWLPHSLEANSTRNLLLNYSALAGFFWSLCDWVNGQTLNEQRGRHSISLFPVSSYHLPQRIRRLLWWLCLNGACVAIVGIIQRQSGTNKLLWLVEPTVFKSAEAHFGPYAYRANGAQLLNLLWPVALGFWWTLHRAAEGRRWGHHVLLPAALLMAASPFIATTRAGAIVAGVLLIATLLLFAGTAIILPTGRSRPLRQRVITGCLILAVAGGGVWLARSLGGEALDRRMLELDSGLVGRENLNEVGRRIARDYPWFGTGPGTLVAVYPLYRDDPEEYWPAQLHNDWLETRITFGWIGLTLILSAAVLVVARWWQPTGIYGNHRLVGMLWLALAGVLLHARFDFPFQIYSVLMTVLALCAVLFSLSSERRA